MFRFNNPDALLVLLLTSAAYCLMRATPAASWRWLVLVGVAMGFAFLTKMLQGFLVLPGFGWPICFSRRRRWRNAVLHLLGAAGALIAAAGWWVLAVQLVPRERATLHRRVDRQHSARSGVRATTGSTASSAAIARHAVIGNCGGSTVRHVGARTGLHRLFTGEMANEISWLLAGRRCSSSAFGIYLAARRALSRGELCALMMWGTLVAW